MTRVNIEQFTGEPQTLIQAFDYESTGKNPQTIKEALSIVEDEIENNQNEDLLTQFNVEKNWMNNHFPTFLLEDKEWIHELSTKNVNIEDFNELELPHNVLCFQFPKDISIGNIKLKSCLFAISNLNTNPNFFRKGRTDLLELVVRVSYLTEDNSISIKEISLKDFINPKPTYNPDPESSSIEFEINLFINFCLNFVADFSHDRGTSRKTLFGKNDIASAA